MDLAREEVEGLVAGEGGEYVAIIYWKKRMEKSILKH